jgi:hypothetical protein
VLNKASINMNSGMVRKDTSPFMCNTSMILNASREINESDWMGEKKGMEKNMKENRGISESERLLIQREGNFSGKKRRRVDENTFQF